MNITSKAKIAVQRDGVDVGEIGFDPSDVLFMERIYGFMDNIEAAESEYEAKAAALDKNTSTDKYGVPTNAREQLKLMRELCEFLRGQIDSVFGEGTSQMVFEDALSLDMIYDFLGELVPHVESVQAERIKKYTNRAQQRAALKK